MDKKKLEQQLNDLWVLKLKIGEHFRSTSKYASNNLWNTIGTYEKLLQDMDLPNELQSAKIEVIITFKKLSKAIDDDFDYRRSRNLSKADDLKIGPNAKGLDNEIQRILNGFDNNVKAFLKT